MHMTPATQMYAALSLHHDGADYLKEILRMILDSTQYLA